MLQSMPRAATALRWHGPPHVDHYRDLPLEGRLDLLSCSSRSHGGVDGKGERGRLSCDSAMVHLTLP